MRTPARDHRVAPAAGRCHLPARCELQHVRVPDQLHRASIQQPHPADDHGQEVRSVPGLPVRWTGEGFVVTEPEAP